MVTIPTFSQLYTSIKADLEASFGDSIPTFGKVFLRAYAGVQAGKLKLYYLGLSQVQKNIFVDSADIEARGGTLERFGRIKLGRNPFPATAGQYDISVTGTIGATIPAQTTFKSNDDSVNPGKLFVLDTAFSLGTSPDTITVRALEAGLDSKMSVGEGMTATAPIAGVSRSATVQAEAVVPLAAEDLEDYRQAALDSYRLEPQGGAATDYRLWASDAQGVQQVYPYAKSGAANEIDLYVEATVLDSIDGRGTPSAALLSAVEAVVEFDPDTTKALNERGRRPLGVFRVNYLPITPVFVDIIINDFEGVTAAQQTAIESALTSFVNQIRPFVAAADIVSNKNNILDVNRIISVILGLYPGSTFGDVELYVEDVYPVSTYTFEYGEIPILISVTFM